MSNIGILGVNKPAGMTSFDVVRQIKKETGIKKIGHGGTLDPMATGVLPILFNEATAFFDVLLNSVKIYETEIQLGAFTDTDDKEGQITETLPVKDITLEEIKKHIES
jgi:tRNA pseudouridine55 synthase